MFELVVAWAFMLAACLLVGEAVCRLAGLRRWSWPSGAIGLCVLLVLGAAGTVVPGRATTMFVVIVALALAAAAWIGWRDRADLAQLARHALDPAVLLALVLAGTLVPFLANGRVGLTGPSFNNDSRFHMWAAEHLLAGEAVPANVLGGGYPLGPHGLVAAVARGLGTGVELAFMALLMLVVALTALTARAVLTDLRRPAAIVLALLVSLGYLLASFYGQAAFKETMLALFVLATAVVLRELVAQGRIGPQAAPLIALLAAATLLTYSYPGLAWIAGTLGLGILGLLVVHRRELRAGATGPAVRRLLATAAVLVAVLLVALAPQAGRILDFFDQLSLSPAGSGVIPTSNIGNLVGQLSPYESLGIWLREDFRYGPENAFWNGALVGLALAALLYAGIWWLRRREVVVLAAAATSAVLFVVVREGESAYLAAKALVVLSAFPLLLVGRALLAPAAGLVPEQRVLRVAVTVVLLGAAGWSSFLTLRNARVNPGVHQRELASLRPLLAGSDVLFLGYDDFIGWRLYGARVTNPPVQTAQPFELRKNFAESANALDFDSVTPATLDRYDFVVTTRTAFASRPPRNFARVRQTRSYDVFRRNGPTPPSELLREREGPGAILDCAGNRRHRRLAAAGGEALVRAKPVLVQGPPGVGAGATVAAELALPSGGRWEISMQYVSPHALTVLAGAGTRWRVVANLGRMGPYWRVGELTTGRPRTVRLALHLDRAAPEILTADSQYALIGKIAAVRTDVPARRVPLRRACGRYVDRYSG